jgi:hypothetical protein
MGVKSAHNDGMRNNGMVLANKDPKWNNSSLFVRNFREYKHCVSAHDCKELRDIAFNAEVKQVRQAENFVLAKEEAYMKEKRWSYFRRGRGALKSLSWIPGDARF